MRNPWLDIPLADYEGHMSLSAVAQAQLLADVFDRMLRKHCPASVAVIGCAGGNGFERIDPAVTRRVVGVDLNLAYIEQAKVRFNDRLPNLELVVGDVQTEEVSFAPVDLAFLGLVLEYVDVAVVLSRVRSLLRGGGVLGTVIQLPSPGLAEVTHSPFASLQPLGSFMRLVEPARLWSWPSAAATRRLPPPGSKRAAASNSRCRNFAFCPKTLRDDSLAIFFLPPKSP